VGERPRVLGVAVGERSGILTRLGPPDVTSDVREHLAAKYASLRAHASQTPELFAPDAAGPRGPRTERYEMGEIESFYVLERESDGLTPRGAAMRARAASTRPG
jgi:LmbE family N-acetylglucosaminyl deacetylase